VSDVVLQTCLGAAIILPILVAFMAYTVEERTTGNLVALLLFPFVATAIAIAAVPVGVEGAQRYNASGEFYWWWIAWAVVIVGVFITMKETYTD
jgi:ABC-type transport system involved in cytochrome c biogenesis permease component